MPQSLAKVYIHIVFSTKKNYRYIDEEIRLEFQGYIVGILNNLGSYTKEIYANPDHIHILCTLPRTVAIAELVNKVKSNSSRWIKSKGIESFRWQDGYGVFSVGESEVEKIQNYIRFQPQHHDTISFKEEMRRFFDEFEIEYDVQYVWD
jgi:REP element-mobilizing transposase RayT